MRLQRVRVTNFRSVEDSGWFDASQVLCLVGKNEAGKTALLQALAGLNPHPATPFAYDRERDYPRRHLTDYARRHGGEEAPVVETEWELTAEEREALAEVVGEQAVSEGPVVASRRYSDAAPRVEPPVDWAKAYQWLLDDAKLSKAEREPLSACTTSARARDALAALAERTARQDALLKRIQAMPGQTLRSAAVAAMPGLPRFMLFSHYDRMAGEVRLDTLAARKAGHVAPALETGEQVFLDFLEYAGTSAGEVSAATTYESLNARCEAASNRITDQLLEYWTQNPDLSIEVRVTRGEPSDPAPFNEGVVARARVRNNLHRVSVTFSERSAGFVWFFSFLVKFARVSGGGGAGLVLLLDEPGLTLHGRAQADLLRYFEERLAPDHQVVFTTHSPFMVPPDRLPAVRTVEDRVVADRAGRRSSEGTKVSADALATDRDALFPLQGALGYEVTQSLFVGRHTLLVEGPGDVLFLKAWSSALKRRGRPGLDPRWTICPAGGIDKIQPFVSLFGGNRLDVAALTDFARGDRRKLDAIAQNRILSGDRLLNFAALLGRDEADAEDVFDPEVYASLVADAFALPADRRPTPRALDDAAGPGGTSRLVKRMEAWFRLLPPGTEEFDHYRPAEWLHEHPALLDGDAPEVAATLDNAHRVVSALNALLRT